jgi:hypothetical protein
MLPGICAFEAARRLPASGMNGNIGNYPSGLQGHKIGGSMISVFRSGFFRGVIVLMFASGALIVGGYGVLLLVEAFNGHGSSAGNVLLFALGLLLLFLSVAAIVVGGLSAFVRVYSRRE